MLRTELAQIRKHLPTIIGIPCAGAVEGVEFGGGKNRSRDGQCHGLVEPLLAGKAYTPFPGLICMFVAIAPPTFYTSTQRRIFTAMWYKIPNDHFALLSHVHLIMTTL